MKKYICPICGYNKLERQPYNEYFQGTMEICPCCGTEFGYDDAVRNKKNLHLRWKKLRGKWVIGGSKWLNPIKKPKDWSAEEQLKNLK